MTFYTYSKLGINGAAGNQLWQIAGTIGKALEAGGYPRFPEWGYRKWFSIPDEYFEPIPEGEECIDLSPDYLQDLSLWYGYDDVPDAFTWSEFAWDQLYANYSDLLNSTSETISVHVRRANNLQLPDHHPVCPLSYFENALRIIGEGQIVVFSDDLDWCRKQDIFKDAYFAKGNDPSVNIYDLTGATPLTLDSVMLDLILMSQCEKHVISNSSFSWWGAFLGYGPQTIYPSKWYGKALSHIDTSVMFPPYWTKL
jgi:hypothetical protein